MITTNQQTQDMTATTSSNAGNIISPSQSQPQSQQQQQHHQDSPARLAASNIDDLRSEDDLVLKRATFSLQRLIKDEDFLDEWLAAGGLAKLQTVISEAQGNTLAYALTSLQHLMEHNYGWGDFDSRFISTLVSVIVKQNLVNICKPATAIVTRLILADKTTETSPIQSYGFEVVNTAVAAQSSFIPTLVHRLSATDYLLQLNSMNLINALFRKATDKYRSKFVYILDALNIRKVLVRLAHSSPPEELQNQLVEFQRLLVQEGHRRKRMPVDMRDPVVQVLFDQIWLASGFGLEGPQKWRKIGFETESPHKELGRVGILGLEAIHSFVHMHSDNFHQILNDMTLKAPERRCPLMRAFVEVLEILADYWEVSTGYTTTSTLQPLLLEFEEIQRITLRFFIRMYAEMEAQNSNPDDVNRAAAVVRSQFRHVMQSIPATDAHGLATFEKEMKTVPYSVVRERQLKELEVDDMLMARIPVRSLRERLYKESYELMKNQRIDCLISGAWFPVIKDKGRVKNTFRYYRLAPNKKFLRYGEFGEMSDRKPSIESLNNKVDMALVTDILTGLSSPIFASKKNYSENSNLTFSLVTSADTTTTSSQSLADFVCSNPTQYAEWIDGFNMLLDKNIATRDTADLIHQLADVGVKLALLDVTGEGVDVPVVPPEVPELPNSWAFHYDEEGGGLKDGLSGLQSLAGDLMLRLGLKGVDGRGAAGDAGGEDGDDGDDADIDASFAFS